MQTIIVLVEPEYSENIGLIARAAKNFGVNSLWLVNPKADYLNSSARSRAMHAKELLHNAKIFPSLPQALACADFSAGTTAIFSKDQKITRNAVTPQALAENFSNSKAKLAILFGRESRGLTNAELELCDFVVNIPSKKEYRTLNVSHAVCIILYELFKNKKSAVIKTADYKTKEKMVSLFESISKSKKGIRNKKAVTASFKHLVARSPVTEREAKAIIAVLDRIEKESEPKQGI